MTQGDSLVAGALRSPARLVVIEAPAGCGKTYQGASFAAEASASVAPGRLLVITHTHAACDEFASRLKVEPASAEACTLDSLITRIATAYHSALGLPSDVPRWARQQPGGFDSVARRVADLLGRTPAIAGAVAVRYPLVVCDEHQDSSEAQERVLLSILESGASLRVFGDPLQKIYVKSKSEVTASQSRWHDLLARADAKGGLSLPHRWSRGSPELGQWIQESRSQLKDGAAVNIQRHISGLQVFRADNEAERHGQYRLASDQRRGIDSFVRKAEELLVLVPTNEMGTAMRAFFGRRIPVWEGHTREALSVLSAACMAADGDPSLLVRDMTKFIQHVSTGFSQSRFGRILMREVEDRCASNRRGMPAKLQLLANELLESPNHIGVCSALDKFRTFVQTDSSFSEVMIDAPRELGDAIRLGEFPDAEEGLGELTLRRAYARPKPPKKCISTIHKAKGLERQSVLIIPCDCKSFADTLYKRRLLYVALSRATKDLALVVPQRSPSPLLSLGEDKT